MSPRSGGRSRPREVPLMPVVVGVALLSLAIGLVNVHARNPNARSASGAPADNAVANTAPADTAPVVTVTTLPRGPAIPSGFLGLSLEYPAIKTYAGSSPKSINPVFVRLVRNLTPGQRPVMRIGGDSADWSWWPAPGISRPPGVTYAIDEDWLRVTSALVHELGAQVLLGLNLAANSTAMASDEARALIGGIGSSSVLAFELGNEPELYGLFPWYRTREGKPVTSRPSGYDFASFLQDFSAFGAALRGVALAGPTTGGAGWTAQLGQFLAAEPQIKLVTLHRYPTQLCYSTPGSRSYPTIGHLLSPRASTGLANSFAPSVAIADDHGLGLRVDELNTVSCGAAPAVSQTFASALWALDTLFELIRVGVEGVNIHTFPGAGYQLFSFNQANGRWHAWVAPEYYGLLMFADAAPPGARILDVSGQSSSGLKVWATWTPDRKVRIVLINKNATQARALALRAPGTRGAGVLERLLAPSVRSDSGVTLGGQSFGSQTDTGTLQGAPQTTAVKPDQGHYAITVPPGSAALLTLQGADG
ncbi:MAG: hypothetical protein JOY58_01575 [Solirubrobacterales bacterium]|nr:hypothetical protein [Solirubrobacterales bacterium]